LKNLEVAIMPYITGFITGLAVSFLSGFVNRKLAEKKEDISAWQGWSVGYYIRLSGMMAAGIAMYILNRNEVFEPGIALRFFLSFCAAVGLGIITDVIISIKRLK